MSHGHSWTAPESDKCELCGDKDWMADKYCSKNPDVAEQRSKWLSEMKQQTPPTTSTET